MKKIMMLVMTMTLLLITGCSSEGQEGEEYDLAVPEGEIKGTLLLPEGEGPYKVAIIHQGSGPTDRDGNSTIAGDNNSLKMVAEKLAEEGIASVRYDKRGIAESMPLIESEEDLVFEDYVNDMIMWIDKVEADDRFDEIYLIGHSEGALISAAAAMEREVEGFISLAGVGERASDTLRRQLSTQPDEITELIEPIMIELENGRLVEDVPEILQSLFRNSIQPYMISWFQYDPVEVYNRIDSPILVIQGDNDVQVTVDDAMILADASGTDPVIIEGMNHVLKNAPEDVEGNLETYGDPDLDLHPNLMSTILEFIKD
ncbi:alpha/beta hydrolase [Gudongella sp. DL1XJH-153]|uniref:alpha/beta hydrolase n=1 Tax=Gudongella sp. DL1XJH-153 TaxID=3409804 RepID=UPI003BB70125